MPIFGAYKPAYFAIFKTLMFRVPMMTILPSTAYSHCSRPTRVTINSFTATTNSTAYDADNDEILRSTRPANCGFEREFPPHSNRSCKVSRTVQLSRARPAPTKTPASSPGSRLLQTHVETTRKTKHSANIDRYGKGMRIAPTGATIAQRRS